MALQVFTNVSTSECAVCDALILGGKRFCSAECESFASAFCAFAKGPDPVPAARLSRFNKFGTWLKQIFNPERCPKCGLRMSGHTEAKCLETQAAFHDAK